MTLKVINMEKTRGSNVLYTILDLGEGSVMGRAIVHYGKRKSWWRFITRSGRKIRNKDTIARMTDAIGRYHDATN